MFLSEFSTGSIVPHAVQNSTVMMDCCIPVSDSRQHLRFVSRYQLFVRRLVDRLLCG